MACNQSETFLLVWKPVRQFPAELGAGCFSGLLHFYANSRHLLDLLKLNFNLYGEMAGPQGIPGSCSLTCWLGPTGKDNHKKTKWNWILSKTTTQQNQTNLKNTEDSIHSPFEIPFLPVVVLTWKYPCISLKWEKLYTYTLDVHTLLPLPISRLTFCFSSRALPYASKAFRLQKAELGWRQQKLQHRNDRSFPFFPNNKRNGIFH